MAHVDAFLEEVLDELFGLLRVSSVGNDVVLDIRGVLNTRQELHEHIQLIKYFVFILSMTGYLRLGTVQEFPENVGIRKKERNAPRENVQNLTRRLTSMESLPV